MSLTTTVDTNNVVDYYTNNEGDLFLKYFLIDSSFNTRGWSVDANKLETLARTSIGAPFTDYNDFPETLFKDGHPWNPKPKATFKEHYDYAAQKAAGYIVDFSPVSRNALKSASGLEIQNNNGYYVTVKITDPEKKQIYTNHPERIPRVSAGILDHDETPIEDGKTVLKNVDLVHLAGVKFGAYGEKARLYAKCSGGYECVNHLKGASDINNTDLNNSSLGEFSTQNKDIMSEQTNALSTNPQDSNNDNLSTQPTNEQNNQPVQKLEGNAEINNNNKEETQANNNNDSKTNDSKSPLRLKMQKFDFNNKKDKEEEKKVPDWKQDPEYLKIAKEVEQLKQERDLEKTKAKYAEIIPRELFILNGKFDTVGYNKELTKAVEKNIDPEFATELYKMKLEKLKLSNGKGKPYGASASTNKEYKTPDTVPDNTNSELKGASDINSSQFASLHNIRKMFGLVKGVTA